MANNNVSSEPLVEYMTPRVIFEISAAESGMLWSHGCRISRKILLDIGITKLFIVKYSCPYCILRI